MKKLTSFFFTACFSAVVSAQCYTVTSTNFDFYPPPPSPGLFSTGDDQWSSAKPIGFTFCFYGAQYDSLLIGTNGVLTFNTDSANHYCMWPIFGAIPSPSCITNSIMAPWNDLKFDAFNGRLVQYWTSGTAPYREFHVNYDSLRMYSCTTNYCSTHIVLYETSNVIEVQLETKDLCVGWNAGRAILGIQNQTGTYACAAPGRNFPMQWTATQEGWVFTPICNVCSGVGVAETQNENDFRSYPNPADGKFTLEISNENSAITSYDVIDVSGRVVRSGEVNPQAKQIEVVLENPGVYFVRVYSGAGEIIGTKRIVCE